MKATFSHAHGIALAVAAFTSFVLQDTSIKALGYAKLPPFEVIGFLGLGQIVLLLASQTARGRLNVLRPTRLRAQAFRSSLDLINNLCVVIALRHITLALFYILVFLAPAVTALLSTLVLREPFGWKRGVAVITGFLGVVVAVNPFSIGQSGDKTGYLACMVCVCCFSVSMIWSQRLTKTETPESLSFISAVMMATAGSLGMLLHFQALVARNMVILAGTSVFAVAGSLSFFTALKHTSAATVSQYHYTQLLTGAFVAYLIWRERPTAAMLAGAVLIVFSGWLAATIAKDGAVLATE